MLPSRSLPCRLKPPSDSTVPTTSCLLSGTHRMCFSKTNLVYIFPERLISYFMSFCSSIKQTNEMKHFPLRMRSSIASLLVHILNRLLQVTLLHTLASWPASYILMQLICMLVYKWCDFICSAVKVTWPAETRNQRASFCAILLAQCSGSKTIDNTSHWQ